MNLSLLDRIKSTVKGNYVAPPPKVEVPFVPSKYQQDIFDWVRNGAGSAVIEAVAGSGKTTTILKALKEIRSQDQTLFLAFNKHIVVELQSKIPDYVRGVTTNSLGFTAIRERFDKVKLDAEKTFVLLDHLVKAKKASADDYKYLRYAIRKLVSVAKAAGVSPSNPKLGIGLLPNTRDTWLELFDKYEVEVGSERVLPSVYDAMKERVLHLSKVILDQSVKNTTIVDFDDQLYLPIVLDLPMIQYDWICVDEAQDLNPVQHRLVLKSLKQEGGRLIAVGDQNQAIFAFRGADSDSLAHLTETFKCVTFPLSISYRCPKAVVREAQRVVPTIQCREGAEEGIVQDLGDVSTGVFKLNDLVICRNNAPLVALAYTLIRDQIPARVRGRDIGEGLISLIKKLKPKSLIQLESKLEKWKTREIKRLRKTNPEANILPVEDKYDCLRCFIEYSGASDVPILIQKIENLFSESSSECVNLSTIHKAKGLEADRVIILDQHLIGAYGGEQEQNLRYVAITRAKKELYYIKSVSKKKVLA